MFKVVAVEKLSERCGSLMTDSVAESGMACMAAVIPIWNLVWRRHTNPMKFGQLILRNII